jgi:hypothetical protein
MRHGRDLRQHKRMPFSGTLSRCSAAPRTDPDDSYDGKRCISSNFYGEARQNHFN